MNLDKIQSVIPEFQMKDFNMFDTITLLKWETSFDCASWEEHKNLILNLTSYHHYQLQLEFIDVTALRFQGTGQIAGFCIRDMSVRGYETSSRYEVGDYENDEIQFFCRDAIIKNLEKMKP